MTKNNLNFIANKIDHLRQKGYTPLITYRGETLVVEFENLELFRVHDKGRIVYLCNFDKRPTRYFSQEEIKYMIDLLCSKLDQEDLERHKIYKEKDKTLIPEWLKDL